MEEGITAGIHCENVCAQFNERNKRRDEVWLSTFGCGCKMEWRMIK
jgi:hypothetical protein